MGRRDLRDRLGVDAGVTLHRLRQYCNRGFDRIDRIDPGDLQDPELGWSKNQ